MNRRIAVLGLSGVGKSTLIFHLNKQHPVLHLQASAPIKAEKVYRSEPPTSSEALRLGRVADNQVLMIAAFQRLAAGSSLPIVFDGRSIVDGRDGIIEIQSDVFASLNLGAIFFMEADPVVIAQRRLTDTSRQRPSCAPKVLAEHQSIARSTAERIAADINCPFNLIRDNGINCIIQFLGRKLPSC